MLRRLGLEDVLEERRVLEKWPEVVGSEIARHTRAVKFEQGILTVSVDNMGWTTQLTYMKPQLLKAMSRSANRVAVKDIRFVLSRGRPRS